MSVEAPSMTPSFSVDTAFSAASGIADIAPSFENFTPNLNSILESDRFVPGEIIRDFTERLVSWVPEEPVLDQPAEHLPDTVHLPGEVTDGPADSHLGGELGRPPGEVIHLRGEVSDVSPAKLLRGGVEEPELKIITPAEAEKIMITAPRVLNEEENYSVSLRHLFEFLESEWSRNRRSEPRGFLPQGRRPELVSGSFLPVISNESLRASSSNEMRDPKTNPEISRGVYSVPQVEEQTPVERKQEEVKGDKTEIIFSDVVRKVDQSASKNRIEIAKKVVEQVDKDEISGFDLKFPDETELIRSRVLWQLGRYFNPDQTWPEFIKEAQRITKNTKDEVLRQIVDINSRLRPIERGGKISEASEEEETRVLGRSLDLAIAKKELV